MTTEGLHDLWRQWRKLGKQVPTTRWSAQALYDERSTLARQILEAQPTTHRDGLVLAAVYTFENARGPADLRLID
jgi:hypothetical protein